MIQPICVPGVSMVGVYVLSDLCLPARRVFRYYAEVRDVFGVLKILLVKHSVITRATLC